MNKIIENSINRFLKEEDFKSLDSVINDITISYIINEVVVKRQLKAFDYIIDNYDVNWIKTNLETKEILAILAIELEYNEINYDNNVDFFKLVYKMVEYDLLTYSKINAFMKELGIVTSNSLFLKEMERVEKLRKIRKLL